LLNLRTTPEALPELLTDQAVGVFEKYEVLSKRELESRYEVMAEQYSTKINIESETLADMARTMVLPAALRQLALAESAGVSAVANEVRSATDDLVDAIHALEAANAPEAHEAHEGDVLDHATYVRDAVLAAMGAVREASDALERLVADDLWQLPRYSEMLFIK
jgi:glutamine synthetase